MRLYLTLFLTPLLAVTLKLAAEVENPAHEKLLSAIRSAGLKIEQKAPLFYYVYFTSQDKAMVMLSEDFGDVSVVMRLPGGKVLSKQTIDAWNSDDKRYSIEWIDSFNGYALSKNYRCGDGVSAELLAAAFHKFDKNVSSAFSEVVGLEGRDIPAVSAEDSKNYEDLISLWRYASFRDNTDLKNLIAFVENNWEPLSKSELDQAKLFSNFVYSYDKAKGEGFNNINDLLKKSPEATEASNNYVKAHGRLVEINERESTPDSRGELEQRIKGEFGKTYAKLKDIFADTDLVDDEFIEKSAYNLTSFKIFCR